MKRWGKTYNEDAVYSNLGPEILDLEISTVCHGIGGVPCKHCYKSNTGNGKNMSLETFKKIFHKLPNNVGQIAFGLGTLNANPDLLDIFWYSRDHGVVPNVTINGDGLTDEWAFKLAEVCGAVAVSRYDDKNVCYEAVQKLTKAGLKQVNIHQLVSQETYQNCLETIEDIQTDLRLEDLNAIVFLSLKQKGRGAGYSPVSYEQYEALVTKCLDAWIRFGMDSCSATRYIRVLENNSKYDSAYMRSMIEPCESSLFSLYCNVDGRVFPCSFTEGEWEGINIEDCEDFIQDIWFSEDIKEFRKLLLNCERSCPIYRI